jgi:hypothetical protein
MRRFPWKTPLIGAAISIFILIAPSLRPFFSRTFVAQLIDLINKVAEFQPIQFLLANNLDYLLFLLPLIISLIIFLIRIKSYFSLCVAGIKPVYLPGKFKETIGFIRNFQDNQSKGEGETQVIQPDSLSGISSDDWGRNSDV